MNILRYFSAILMTLIFINVKAQKVTWSEDIACIIYSHCSPCHNSEANSSLTFMSYSDVFNQRLAVELFVNTGQMPPAMHAANYGKFKTERHLTQNEIDLIRTWALDQALEGDPNLAPPTPVFAKRVASMSNPDISFKTNFSLPDTIEDHLRQCFVIRNPLNSDKLIKAIEVIPSNGSVVHSVYIYLDTSSIPLQKDLADSDSGYGHFYGTGSISSKPIYGWALDVEPFNLIKGLNLKVDSNSYFIIQIQYSDEGGGHFDSTLINISFDTASSNVRQVSNSRFLSHDLNLVNGPFIVPVDSTKVFHEQQRMANDITLLSISPNAHGFCDSMEVFALLPGNDSIRLLKIKDWEAAWSEGTYYFKKPVHLPAGSVLHAFATYSNTLLNQHDPDDPLEILHAGANDDEEEMVFYFSHLPYLSGDENMIIDSFEHNKHHLTCLPMNGVSRIRELKSREFQLYPNPAANSITLNYFGFASHINIDIFNSLGQLCTSEKFNEIRKAEINITELKSGIYLMRITSQKNYSEFKRFIVEK
jgi:hypothetical protein